MSYVDTTTAGRVSLDTLETLTGPQLAALAQELGTPVKRFSSRAAGIKRVRPLVEAAIAKASEPRKATPPGRRKPFDFAPLPRVRRYRQGTLRAKLIETLRREGGATFDECAEATGWDHKNLYQQIFALNSYVGFGVREDEEGNIRLTTADEERPSCCPTCGARVVSV